MKIEIYTGIMIHVLIIIYAVYSLFVGIDSYMYMIMLFPLAVLPYYIKNYEYYGNKLIYKSFVRIGMLFAVAVALFFILNSGIQFNVLDVLTSNNDVLVDVSSSMTFAVYAIVVIGILIFLSGNGMTYFVFRDDDQNIKGLIIGITVVSVLLFITSGTNFFEYTFGVILGFMQLFVLFKLYSRAY